MNGTEESQISLKPAQSVEAPTGTKNAKRKREWHGESTTRLYATWAGMKSRCTNKKSLAYKWYGLRGITVCEEWAESFISFKKWAMKNSYQDNLEIDRIDGDGNYEPSNCRFVTKKENLINKGILKTSPDIKLTPHQSSAARSMLGRVNVWVNPDDVNLPYGSFIYLFIKGLCERRLNPENNWSYQYRIAK